MSINRIDGPSSLDPVQSFAEAKGGESEKARGKPDKEVSEVQERGEQKQNEFHASALPNAAMAASAKKISGTVKRPVAKKEKYPEDVTYEETAPNARVWRTYEDESNSHDANMVEESRDNVDVLLVFAGLFSAV
ncbi:uncharacterized protein EV420DRAFT_1506250 [Desarmillaria tabescens]|uniref:DUF6535 domain-containing protein n=1 Tax=Armillaria tabescens TaxID=1929756 RepID=A0AA39TYQ3_ARMTA|nr:uncharacterized protein EV420DRAFT_1506250 [Desarmillaria tabescens]KAK0466934.1 hypothetical protein EV420DRAFT_1506250 [Desarmillaria tabescens]